MNAVFYITSGELIHLQSITKRQTQKCPVAFVVFLSSYFVFLKLSEIKFHTLNRFIKPTKLKHKISKTFLENEIMNLKVQD